MADEEIDIYRGTEPCFVCHRPAEVRIGTTLFCASDAKAFAPGERHIIDHAVARAQLEARPAPTQAEPTTQ